MVDLVPTPCAYTIKFLGLVDYVVACQAMKIFTQTRHETTADQIWVLEHPPVYTLGLAAKEEHLLLNPRSIPVIRSDRGGQITYHGPGQLIVYLLINFKRLNMSVRELVLRIEAAIIATLADYQLCAHGRPHAPGVYINQAKIASLGLRIMKGAVYHGLALNVAMDLSPFNDINPCGYPGLAVTQLQDLGIESDVQSVAHTLLPHLTHCLDSKTVR